MVGFTQGKFKGSETEKRLESGFIKDDQPQRVSQERPEQQTEQEPVIEKNEVIKLGKQAEATPSTSLTEQVQKSAALPLGHPGSLKTTALLGGALGLTLAASAFVSLGVGTAAASTAGSTTFATNTANIASTSSWIARLAGTAKTVITNPIFVASTLVGAIGSYPFAGFIREEALQTLGFGVRSATESGDVAGAEEAIEFQKEVLNPGIWQEIFSKIPYVNVLAKLKEFYEAATIKLSIDEKIVNDMKIQVETGETEEVKWERIRQEEEDSKNDIVDYYNEQRQILLKWEREAEVTARAEDAAFWRKEREAQSKREKEDAEAMAKFWLEYRKEAQKINEANRPSNLNFGLL